MSMALLSPMRGIFFAAAGSSENSEVAMTRSPAPAANSISVAPGAMLTIRRGTCASVTLRPASSTTVMPDVAGSAGTLAASSSTQSASRRNMVSIRKLERRRVCTARYLMEPGLRIILRILARCSHQPVASSAGMSPMVRAAHFSTGSTRGEASLSASS
jgi:hypothetical protein